jgi:aspartate/methionine/tyrosine aminotransferase
VLALPQLKLGWVATLGPDAVVAEALSRLEMIADTYLSVATSVQLALSALLDARSRVQAALRARVETNLAALDAALATQGASCPVRRLATDGGWYAILEAPRTRDEDAWVTLLVREEGAIVHPGYFFDMEGEGFLVVSLLPEPAAFADAIRRVVARVASG